MTKRKEKSSMREKLSKSRELCKGMSKEVYALADYISKVSPNINDPSELALRFSIVFEDIQNEENRLSNKADESKELFEYLVANKEEVLNQAVYIPQVIDVIAEEEFARDFRKICKSKFGFNPPKRFNVELGEEYPKYIKVAVDWWTNVIINPKIDNGIGLSNKSFALAVNLSRSYTKEEIKTFKESLADNIVKLMEKNKKCKLSVSHCPCHALAIAGEKIGIDNMIGYPWMTYMKISENEIAISEGYEAEYETLWTNK